MASGVTATALEFDREELDRRDVSGDGHRWRKKITEACTRHGLSLEELAQNAGHCYFAACRKPRQQKEIQLALRALQDRSWLRRTNGEPHVAHFIRAYASCLLQPPEQMKLAA
ncbi:MAG TPA: hypothetical protein VEA36_00665 [Candidatus Paceibacterota bacterium]|nr:hypothetical protein [Candidatus Paceibacterota bacterium]